MANITSVNTGPMSGFKSETCVILLLDESQSMEDSKTAVLTSVNNFIDEQKRAGNTGNISIIKFNQNIIPLCIKCPARAVPRLTINDYTPEFTTSLNDAIGFAMESHHTLNNVIMIIITDGIENSSSKYDISLINSLITTYKQFPHNWKFVYLANDLSLQGQGESLGIYNTNGGDVNATVSFDELDCIFSALDLNA